MVPAQPKIYHIVHVDRLASTGRDRERFITNIKS